MQAAQTPAINLRFVTPDKESSMNTLWQEEKFKALQADMQQRIADGEGSR